MSPLGSRVSQTKKTQPKSLKGEDTVFNTSEDDQENRSDEISQVRTRIRPDRL